MMRGRRREEKEEREEDVVVVVSLLPKGGLFVCLKVRFREKPGSTLLLFSLGLLFVVVDVVVDAVADAVADVAAVNYKSGSKRGRAKRTREQFANWEERKKIEKGRGERLFYILYWMVAIVPIDQTHHYLPHHSIPWIEH